MEQDIDRRVNYWGARRQFAKIISNSTIRIALSSGKA